MSGFADILAAQGVWLGGKVRIPVGRAGNRRPGRARLPRPKTDPPIVVRDRGSRTYAIPPAAIQAGIAARQRAFAEITARRQAADEEARLARVAADDEDLFLTLVRMGGSMIL